MSYPNVKIFNSTSFNASGTVEYMSVFCKDNTYSVTTNTKWEAESRGVCLLTKITASIVTPQGTFEATPYTSSGTSYSHFAIMQTGNNEFAVSRVVTSTEDSLPEDYVEPTEDQN